MANYEKLVKALRVCNRIDHVGNCNVCYYGSPDAPPPRQLVNGCKRSMCEDAADAIEALQAQLPKRGEWISEDLDNFRKYKVTCPHCGAWYVGNYDAYVEPCGFNYCPHCGNICNPTNIEYENELKEREKEARAKMEVQDG